MSERYHKIFPIGTNGIKVYDNISADLPPCSVTTTHESCTIDDETI